jgi:hypothetical protein
MGRLQRLATPHGFLRLNPVFVQRYYVCTPDDAGYQQPSNYQPQVSILIADLSDD